MIFAVTPLYALPLAVIFLILWFRTTSMRGAMKLSIGDGGSPELLLRILGNSSNLLSTGILIVLLAMTKF